MFRWMTGIAVGAALLIFAVGCGGGSGGESTTEVTKAEFTKQANVICAEGKEKRSAAYDDYSKEIRAKIGISKRDPKYERAQANKMIAETVIPSLETQRNQLEELDAPASDEAQISKMLNSLSKAAVELENGGIRKLISGGKLLNFQEEAESYGLTCDVY